MLVLSRKRGEQIVIGDGAELVTLSVIDIRGDVVRLGVEAPKHISIHRREVWDRIQAGEQKRERRAA